MLPKYLKPFLWSYDFTKLDPKKDQQLIITNILNLGSKKATDWLFATYSKRTIQNAIQKSPKGNLNKKSAHFWSFILNIKQHALRNTR